MMTEKKVSVKKLVSNENYHLGSSEKQTETKQLGCIELSFNAKSKQDTVNHENFGW